MKKLLLSLFVGLFLMGCQSAPDYERNEEMGSLNEITIEEVHERMDNKETFMFMFTQETCSNCQAFKEDVLSSYIKNHGFEYNEIVLSHDMDTEPIYAFVEEHPNPEDMLPEGDYSIYDVLTPTFYFVENGEVKDIYVGGDMTTKIFDGYIQKYRLDEVK